MVQQNHVPKWLLFPFLKYRLLFYLEFLSVRFLMYLSLDRFLTFLCLQTHRNPILKKLSPKNNLKNQQKLHNQKNKSFHVLVFQLLIVPMSAILLSNVLMLSVLLRIRSICQAYRHWKLNSLRISIP